MESVFLAVLNRSIAAGWLILAIAVLRLFLKKAPKSIRPWLWALVLARLVWPRFRESPLSLLPSAETVPRTVLERGALQVRSGIAVFNSAVNERLADLYEAVPIPAGHTRSAVSICAAVWLAGMALMVLWALFSSLRLRRRVAEAVPGEDVVWICGGIGSPFLLGILRPRIYLPEGLDGENRTYVLAHERAHIRRRDHLTKPLGWLLLSVYWFHPLVWLAYVLFCRDVELACDERVISELGPACKKPYSAALLACSVRGSGLAACPLAFGEVGVKERVKNVLNYKKPAFWAVLACAAVVAAAAVCFLTDPVPDPPESSVSYANLGASQPEEPAVFAAGALLYMDQSMSYQPVDGGGYTPVLYGMDRLTLGSGEPVTYRLEEAAGMAWDNLYDYFPELAEEEEYFGTHLTDHNDLVITARFYGDGSGNPGPSVWTIQKEGGGQRWWLYCGGRLFALINLDDAFPFQANGVLWTYAPDQSDILPIRFDMEGGAEVFAGPDGLLSLDPRGKDWARQLRVEKGRTVYWKPPLDGDGRPMANTELRYRWDHELDGKSSREEETLTIRPVMDYAGLYGGVTCGISNVNADMKL